MPVTTCANRGKKDVFFSTGTCTETDLTFLLTEIHTTKNICVSANQTIFIISSCHYRSMINMCSVHNVSFPGRIILTAGNVKCRKMYIQIKVWVFW